MLHFIYFVLILIYYSILFYFINLLLFILFIIFILMLKSKQKMLVSLWLTQYPIFM